MHILNTVKNLTTFEKRLWSVSLFIVTLSFFIANDKNYMTLIACIIGVTALIFVSRGDVLGQILTVVFAVFYGIISLSVSYYGEMITYLCMTAPIAVLSVITWIRNPYDKAKRQVAVNKLRAPEIILLFFLTLLVTAVFYPILKYFNTANLFFSTLSVSTSFIASYLTMRRSPYYGLGYALNDMVLIILWIAASFDNIRYLSMVACFAIFLINDIYGFINWSRMKKKQEINITLR